MLTIAAVRFVAVGLGCTRNCNVCAYEVLQIAAKFSRYFVYELLVEEQPCYFVVEFRLSTQWHCIADLWSDFSRYQEMREISASRTTAKKCSVFLPVCLRVSFFCVCFFLFWCVFSVVLPVQL